MDTEKLLAWLTTRAELYNRRQEATKDDAELARAWLAKHWFITRMFRQ